MAWLGLAVQYQGQPLEESPHSLLARFFATYWLGTSQQCGGDVDAAGRCTLCTFPAAAVIAHGLFCLAFVAALWVTCARLAAAVLNNRLRRRMRLFQLAYSLLAVAGGLVAAGRLIAGLVGLPGSCRGGARLAPSARPPVRALHPRAAGVAALGVSTVQDPFSWLNQGCWAAYVGTVALTVGGQAAGSGHGAWLLPCQLRRWSAGTSAGKSRSLACPQVLLSVWEVAVVPTHQLRSVDKVSAPGLHWQAMPCAAATGGLQLCPHPPLQL